MDIREQDQREVRVRSVQGMRRRDEWSWCLWRGWIWLFSTGGLSSRTRGTGMRSGVLGIGIF